MADAAAVPPPPAPVDLAVAITPLVWPAGRVLHRVHPDAYGATVFNPGVNGNARFSPIRDGSGAPIPTLYGGTSFDCAAMETVFHDVPHAPGLKTVDRHRIADKVHAVIAPTRDLALADLTATALRRLGVRRGDLIDTEKDRYPGTRLWAEAIHAACPALEGLAWVSRQDDRAMAVVLFGDRIASTDLATVDPPRPLFADVAAYGELLALAERIGVLVV